MAHPSPVIIRDTSLRDGLQSVATVVGTADKLRWLRGLYDAGLREVEVGSFVPARLLPQLADTAEVVAAGLQMPGLRVSVLVPNLRGAHAALASGAHLMTLPVSASRLHSLANLRKTPHEAIEEMRKIVAARDAAGSACRIEGGVGTAFGCTLQGHVAEDEVLDAVRGLLNVGVDVVSVADTVGHADPAAVERLFAKVLDVAGDRLGAAHFHDTRGLGLANVGAALRAGIQRFDASLAGIGGCPHAPGASGNVTTEDLVYMLERMGHTTGIDVQAVLALRRQVGDWLPLEQLNGSLWRAGVPPHHLPAATTPGRLPSGSAA